MGLKAEADSHLAFCESFGLSRDEVVRSKENQGEQMCLVAQGTAN